MKPTSALRSTLTDGSLQSPPDSLFRGRPLPVQTLDGTPTPAWARVVEQAYAGSMGFAYMVAKDGREVAYAASGLTRSSREPVAPDLPWNPLTSPMNLASVSKPITAFAIMTALQQHENPEALKRPFWSLIQSRFPNLVPGEGVTKVTVENLLQMKSGLVPDGTLFVESLEGFLRTYLIQPVAAGATPGVTYAYSNTNFTILQLVYESLCGMPYVEGVNSFVFGPMGLAIDQGEMTTSPDATTGTLAYNGGSDLLLGQAWPDIPCVAAGGWIGWPHGALQFLIGVRERAVLNVAYTDRMLKNELGW